MRHKETVDLTAEATKLSEAVKAGDMNTAYTVSGRIQRATREALKKAVVAAIVPPTAPVAVAAPAPEVPATATV